LIKRWPLLTQRENGDHNYIERQDGVDDGQVTEADGYVFGKTTDER
jgi:hypothetical protein